MRVALRLADGDRSRLRVLSATEVLVCNGPRTALYAPLSRRERRESLNREADEPGQ
jgi:hypothetical protein